MREEKGSGDLYEKIEKKRNGISFTRGCHIYLSKRLDGYHRFWQFIFFTMNIEAVVIVVLSLTKTIEVIEIGNFSMDFGLFSGLFTLYVILLQYYVSTLNYAERSFRAHYMQIELEDWIIALDKLLVQLDKRLGDEKDVVDSFYMITNMYQLSLKNSNNHEGIDFRRVAHDNHLRRERQRKRAAAGALKEQGEKGAESSVEQAEAVVLADAGKEKAEDRKAKRARKKRGRPRDFTLDMLLIVTNGLLSGLVISVVLYVIIY